MATRRRFVLNTVSSAAVLMAATPLGAAEPARLEETDPIAVALGYKNVAALVDVQRFPTYVDGHDCKGCKLFQAAGGEQWAPCGVVPGKLVNAGGWCAAWVKRA